MIAGGAWAMAGRWLSIVSPVSLLLLLLCRRMCICFNDETRVLTFSSPGAASLLKKMPHSPVFSKDSPVLPGLLSRAGVLGSC